MVGRIARRIDPKRRKTKIEMSRCQTLRRKKYLTEEDKDWLREYYGGSVPEGLFMASDLEPESQEEVTVTPPEVPAEPVLTVSDFEAIQRDSDTLQEVLQKIELKLFVFP